MYQHPLLKGHIVGKARQSTRDLPDEEHVYGYKCPPQIEGAKQIIHTQKLEKLKKKSKNKKNFKMINTFTQGSELLKNSNMDIRIKEKKGNNEMKIKLPENNFAYGISTQQSIPISKIIKNEFGNFEEKKSINKYLTWASEKSKVKKLKSKNTTANILRMQRNKENYKEKYIVESKPLFKMKRFCDVESKIRK